MKTRWVNKLPKLCFFFPFFHLTQNKLRDLCISYFSQIKCGPSIRILFVFRLLFEWIYQSFQYGERSRWNVYNRGKISVLKVFDVQNSNCSQSSGARCSTEKLHINIIFFINNLLMSIINMRKSRFLHDFPLAQNSYCSSLFSRFSLISHDQLCVMYSRSVLHTLSLFPSVWP